MSQAPSQIERLFHVLSRLQSGRELGIVELAEQCACSRRAVMRDIRLLRQWDFAISEIGGTQTYVLRGSKSAVCPLDAEEVMLLALAVELSPLRRLPVLAAKIGDALLKLLEPFPPSQRQEIRRLLSLCEVEGGARRERPDVGELLLAVLYALRSGRDLRVVYRGDGDQRISCKIRPYRLLLAGGSWHLVCRLASDESIIRLDIGTLQQAVPVEDAGAAKVGPAESGMNASAAPMSGSVN